MGVAKVGELYGVPGSVYSLEMVSDEAGSGQMAILKAS